MCGWRNRLVVGVALATLGFLAMFFDAGQVAAQSVGGSAPVRIIDPIPLPVRNVDPGTRFTITTPKTSPIGEPPEVAFSLDVPAGHFALVEQVSVRLYACANSTITLQEFRLNAGSKSVFLIPVHVPPGLMNSYLANEQTKFVAEPGETIRVETDNLSFSSTCGPLSMDATISGVVLPAS